MGDWTLRGNAQRFETVGLDVLARPKAVYPSLSANTKGLWVELTPATTVDATALVVQISEGYGGSDYLVDIGIGPAGSEQIIIADVNLSIGSTTYDGTIGLNSRFPLPIPAGTRIAARAQATGTSSSRYVQVAVTLENNGQPTGGQIITIGANAADSGGVAIDSGVVDNTKGSWYEISASCPADLRGVIIGFGTANNTAMTRCSWLCDLGIGGAGSEQVLIPDIVLAAHDYPDAITPIHTPRLDVSIPAGTRISARAACTIVDATDRKFDIFIYGIV